MTSPTSARIIALPPFKPDLHERAWASIPHPTLPLLATAHSKAVTVFSLSTASAHSTLTGGHTRSVRSAAWKPHLPPHRLCLVTGSFDSTAGIWRWDGDEAAQQGGELEVEVTQRDVRRKNDDDSDDDSPGDKDWEFTLVLEGHDSEIKSCAFSPSGTYLATFWGIQWESRPRPGDLFPRLLTFSADGTIRVWTLQQEEDTEDGTGTGSRSALGGIPNTMRRSLREEWTCTAVLPKAHTRDIYSVTWSAQTGLVASTGSDGVVALYTEDNSGGDIPATGNSTNAEEAQQSSASTSAPASTPWRLLATHPGAHGPYEINHITWCRRYDAGSERRGEEEMLVTTGDDGIVRPWQVEIDAPR
ncbi:Cytosolic iron-sulfur protein assembly protein [Fusarium falciforme]|nr:Cytosolic iron-sulfur protein assembly protein [Fusarium falciforme]